MSVQSGLERVASSVRIVKFLLSLNTKAEQRKGTKTWKTNVRIVIYWESVSNTHSRPGWHMSDGPPSIVCLLKAALGRSFPS